VTDHREDLVLVDESSNNSLILRPLMPPVCSLSSSTRSCMPSRVCLPKPAIGPERSWIEPSRISFLLTPCCSAAKAPQAARPRVAARAARHVLVIESPLSIAFAASCGGARMMESIDRSVIRKYPSPGVPPIAMTRTYVGSIANTRPERSAA
jgi:hypothetical protein